MTPGSAVARDVLRVRHKDGTWRDLEIAAVNHLDDPIVEAIVVTYHDVTDRKRAAAALRDVAHDFNNVLTAILASAELLLETLPDGHAGREDADQIREATLRAADLAPQLLPRVDALVEPISSPAPPRGSLRGSETFLIVEDQEEIRRLTRRMLEARGYHVLVAASGAEALGVAAPPTERIDLLMTDVVMPGMSGLEVALLLQPARSNMKVLFVSGHTTEAIVDHGVLRPGVAFLEKPFTAQILAQKVREVLDAPRAESDIATIV